MPLLPYFLHATPTNTTTPFLLSFFIILPLPMLASLSHPPTSVYHLRRIREQNNILRRLICRIKPINISTDSFRLVHLISWMSVSCGNEWMLSNACQTLFNSLLAYDREEEVALKLNSISIDCKVSVIFFFIQLSSLWCCHVPANPCVLPYRHDFLCFCGSWVFTQDVEGAERMFEF